MRRSASLLLLLGLGLAGPAAAQTPRVELRVGLGPDSFPMHARQARVQVRNLFDDKRWSDALDELFPIRLSFRLEIWRSREGWIDQFQRAAEWATVVQREPLQDQFRVTQLFLSGPKETRFATRDEMARWLSLTNEVDALPAGPGTYYYTVTLTITALSDEEMEAVERFLAGEPAAPAGPQNSSIGKKLRQILLRFAGFPWDQREARTESFRLRP